MDFDASFILAGFHDGFAMLAKTTGKGVVKISEELAAIGSGEYLATASLLSREHSEINNIDQTVYNVYEAKRYAEGVSTVGKTTTLQIFRPNSPVEYIEGKGLLFLNAEYIKYGPKTLPGDFKVDKAFFGRRRSLEDVAATTSP